MNNQNLTPQYLQHHDDEIDLKELFLALWRGKWIIILITFAFAVGGVLYALSQPNTYKAEAILASASDSKSGGLASLAGISLGGGGTDNKAMALATLQSRQFLNAFVNKYDLLVPLMAGEKWNPAQDKLIINPEMYDEQQLQWVREVEPGKTSQPTDWDAYKEFKKYWPCQKVKTRDWLPYQLHTCPPPSPNNG